jgi:tRNA(Ile)-lysidine synthase
LSQIECELGLAGAVFGVSGPSLQGGVALALSGGVDSICLLDLLARAGLVQAVLSVDHGLQADSAKWLAFCAQRAAHYGLPFYARTLHISPLTLKRDGLEQAARQARYAAFEPLMRKSNTQVLALAQHADDQAETFLLQALRGAGLAGLAAMPVWQMQQARMALWRPLLGVKKLSLLAYANVFGLVHVNDPSNAQLRYTRNALRHRVMPVLEQLHPAYRVTLARAASHAASAQQILEEVAQTDLQQTLSSVGLNTKTFAKLSVPRQLNLLRWWLAQTGLRAISHARLLDLRAQLLTPGIALGTVLLSHEGQEIVQAKAAACLRAKTLPAVAQPRIVVRPLRRGERLKENACLIDTTGLQGVELQSRLARSSDRFQVYENGPHRRLKNLFQEAAWSVSQRRSALALLAQRPQDNAPQVVYVAGLGVSAPFRPANRTNAWLVEWQIQQ